MTDFLKKRLLAAEGSDRPRYDHECLSPKYSRQDPESAARELRNAMQGRVVLREDHDYVRVRRIWNAAVEHQPALIALCKTTADVRAAVRGARRHGLSISVRRGGHHWAGCALCPDGLVVDVSEMRKVDVDPHSCVADVAGGATVMDVASAAAVHGLVAALGNCGKVGMAGLTLGGGYGPLCGLYGLAADNLLAAEVVLADGKRVTASPEREKDLFWAIRGGGGNFGVVTSFKVRLHRSRHMLAGIFAYPLSEAEAVLRRYDAFVATMPDELSVPITTASAPDQATITLMPLWNGEQDGGERAMKRLKSFGEPLVARFGRTTHPEMLAPFDELLSRTDGCHWEMRTRWLPKITSDAVAAVAKALARKTSPLSMVNWHHLHGAATRFPTDATAFGLRDQHFMVEIIAGWEPDGSDGAVHRQWAHDLWESLLPFALPGGYANLLPPHERAQARNAYGKNGARLNSLKRRLDPDGVFASAIPLPTLATR